MIGDQVVIGLQGAILLILGIGVKGIISINVHLARLNGKVHELELADRIAEADMSELKQTLVREHRAIWDKVDVIDRRCIDVIRSGGK